MIRTTSRQHRSGASSDFYVNRLCGPRSYIGPRAKSLIMSIYAHDSARWHSNGIKVRESCARGLFESLMLMLSTQRAKRVNGAGHVVVAPRHVSPRHSRRYIRTIARVSRSAFRRVDKREEGQGEDKRDSYKFTRARNPPSL